MELTVKDRIYITSLLPIKSSLKNMKLKSQIKKIVDFSPEETEEIDLKLSTTGEGITWNPSAAKTKEVDFTPEQLELMSEGIDKLDEKQEIADDMIETFEKIKGAI